MTFVRNNIKMKFINASRQNNKFDTSDYINNWKFGDPIKLPNGKGDEYIIEVKNIFNICDISNHVNDLDYFLNKGIEYNKDKIYKGKVVKIMEFGAFVNFLGKQDWLVHISELAEKRVAKVTDVVKEGDEVKVKVIGFDRGKVKLSIKQAIVW